MTCKGRTISNSLLKQGCKEIISDSILSIDFVLFMILNNDLYDLILVDVFFFKLCPFLYLDAFGDRGNQSLYAIAQTTGLVELEIHTFKRPTV